MSGSYVLQFAWVSAPVVVLWIVLVINTTLLLFVFDAERKKNSAYALALAIGAVKATIYLLFGKGALLAAIMGLAFVASAAGFVYFLRRVNRRKSKAGGTAPSYVMAHSDRIEFMWEYVALVFILFILVGGETAAWVNRPNKSPEPTSCAVMPRATE